MSEIEQIFIKEEVFLEGDDDDDDEDIEDALSGTPDVLELEDNEEKTTIPEHSQSIYWNVYNNFMDWKKSVGMTDINPDVLLAYFKELSKKYKPPSLWSKYSMLKRTIKIKHNNIDIHDFTPLLDYLKKENKGYEPKKSEPLTVNDVKKFLSEAPDDEYLAMKVSLIVALFGGCRLCDLVKLSNKDVEEHGQIIKITLRNKRNNTIKTFVIEGEMLQPIKAYKALRPENADHDRFFLSYRNGKCINMPLGKNKFGTMPKEIAQFLKLPNPEHYTGHSFKRSSTSLCKEKGISMSDLKRLNAFRKTTAVPEKKPQERVVIRNTVLPATKPLERAVNRTMVVPEKNQLESSVNKTIKTKDGKVYRVIKCTDKEVAWLVGKRTPEEPILNSTQAPRLPKRIISGNPGTSHKNEIQEPEVKKSKVAEAPPKSSTNIKIVSNLSSLGDKLILYSYWRSSCSYRVRIALNLKEIPYDIKPINLEKGGGEQHGDEFRKINPMARVPALHIDNHTLIESLNILQYLEETRPQHPLLPADPLQRSQVREICDIIASGIQPLQNVGVFNHLTKQQIKDWPQFWITRGFLAIEELLSFRAGKYCVGDDITLADCCLVPQVYNARKFKIDMKPFRKILQIDQDLQNHPAFIAAHPNNQPDYPKRVGG